jgi:hypothetical protein
MVQPPLHRLQATEREIAKREIAKREIAKHTKRACAMWDRGVSATFTQ